MASGSAVQEQFEILEVLQGPPTLPVHYRISVGSSIKYLTASQPRSSLPDIHGEHLAFDTVPVGDWNVANLLSDGDGKLIIASTEKKRFPDVTPRWHASYFDLLELWRLRE